MGRGIKMTKTIIFDIIYHNWKDFPGLGTVEMVEPYERDYIVGLGQDPLADCTCSAVHVDKTGTDVPVYLQYRDEEHPDPTHPIWNREYNSGVFSNPWTYISDEECDDIDLYAKWIQYIWRGEFEEFSPQSGYHGTEPAEGDGIAIRAGDLVFSWTPINKNPANWSPCPQGLYDYIPPGSSGFMFTNGYATWISDPYEGECTHWVGCRLKALGSSCPYIWTGIGWWNDPPAGWERSYTPVAGAIACYSNHVGFVESVSGSTVIYSHGNYDPDTYGLHRKIYVGTHHDSSSFMGYIISDVAGGGPGPGPGPTPSKGDYNPIIGWGGEVTFDRNECYITADVAEFDYARRDWDHYIQGVPLNINVTYGVPTSTFTATLANGYSDKDCLAVKVHLVYWTDHDRDKSVKFTRYYKATKGTDAKGKTKAGSWTAWVKA